MYNRKEPDVYRSPVSHGQALQGLPVASADCFQVQDGIKKDQLGVNAYRSFKHNVYLRHTTFIPRATAEDPAIHEIYAALVEDAARNVQIVDDIVSCVSEGRYPLVLTERLQHLTLLEEALRGQAEHVVVLRGGMGKKQRKAVMAQLSAVSDEEPRVILATGRYIGEGLDAACLDTLFLAMPISWRGTLQQYVGRLHRLHNDKHEVRVYDYADQKIPMLKRMLAKRIRGYRAIGYTVNDG